MKYAITVLVAALALIGVAVAAFGWDSMDYASGQPNIQSEPESASQFGGYGDDEAFAQDQSFGGKSSKLRCSIWTDNDIYMTEDRINLYYWISKPCYAKIVIARPDGTKSTIGPTWKNAGTYSVPGVAKEPYGDRQVSLKTWTKTKPQQICRDSCSYAVGFVGLRSPAGPADEQLGEPADEQLGEPADEQYGEPADEQYGEPADEQYGEPADEQYGEPADEQYGEPADEQYV